MSNIERDGKIINAPGYGTTNGAGQCRYKDTGCTEIDWFATHPRPVEPKPLAAILTTEKGTLEFKGEDGTKIQATTPIAPVPVVVRTDGEYPYLGKADEAAPSNTDVPQAGLQGGRPVEGLAPVATVPAPAVESASPATDVPVIDSL